MALLGSTSGCYRGPDDWDGMPSLSESVQQLNLAYNLIDGYRTRPNS